MVQPSNNKQSRHFDEIIWHYKLIC